MRENRRSKEGWTKLTLDTYLQLKSDAAESTTPQPHSAPPSRDKQKIRFDGYIEPHAGYTQDWPTPAEVRARQFVGLCLDCQLIFSTWGPPNGGMNIRHRERKNAHHTFDELKRCQCPLCRMLLREFRHYDENVVQRVQESANRSHVRIYEHLRQVPCHYVELVFEFEDRTLRPCFKMFIAGEVLRARWNWDHRSNLLI